MLGKCWRIDNSARYWRSGRIPNVRYSADRVATRSRNRDKARDPPSWGSNLVAKQGRRVPDADDVVGNAFVDHVPVVRRDCVKTALDDVDHPHITSGTPTVDA
jgi:hypothetical protein